MITNIYQKLHLMVHKISTRKSIKAELTSVAFFGDRVQATDSFMAIDVSVPKGEKLEKPVLIGAKMVRKFASDPFEFECMYGSNKLPKIEGTFPDIDVVFEREEKGEHVEIRLNAEKLEKLLSVMKHVNKFQDVRMLIPKEKGRAVILVSENDKQKARALLMPMNG